MNVILIKPSPDIEVQAFELIHDRRQKKQERRTKLEEQRWGKTEEQEMCHSGYCKLSMQLVTAPNLVRHDEKKKQMQSKNTCPLAKSRKVS